MTRGSLRTRSVNAVQVVTTPSADTPTSPPAKHSGAIVSPLHYFMFIRPALRSLAFTSLRPAHFSIPLKPAAGPATSLHILRSYSVTTTRMAQEFKLKGLSKLDLNNGDKVEAEVEGIE